MLPQTHPLPREGAVGGRLRPHGLGSPKAFRNDLLQCAGSYRDGTTEIARLKPESPSFVVAGAQTSLEVAGTYFRLGVDHILSGIDHLLFVLALILLIHNRWTLAKTITAFTIAHSITLAGAALGYFR